MWRFRKGKLLAAMKKHKLEKYSYNGVEINVVHEDETVKGEIHKNGDEPKGKKAKGAHAAN